MIPLRQLWVRSFSFSFFLYYEWVDGGGREWVRTYMSVSVSVCVCVWGCVCVCLCTYDCCMYMCLCKKVYCMGADYAEIISRW